MINAEDTEKAIQCPFVYRDTIKCTGTGKIHKMNSEFCTEI